MSTDQTANYYLVINGQPQGPFTAAMVMNQLKQGSIDGNTLICAAGGTAWLPVQQMAAVLSAAVYGSPPVPLAPASSTAPTVAAPASAAPPMATVSSAPAPVSVPALAPPPMATGYGSASSYSPAGPPAMRGDEDASAGRTQYHTPRSFRPQPIVAETPVDNTKGLRLTVLLAALGCFFLPWLEFSCSGKPIVSQTGMQTILNKGTPDQQFLNTAKGMSAQAGKDLPPGLRDGNEDMGKEVGASITAGAALVCLGLAFLAALGNGGRTLSGLMAGVALGCLLIAMSAGFPMEDALKKSVDQQLGPLADQARARSAISGENPLKTQMGIDVGTTMVKDMFKVKYTPWFYGELGALGAACLVGLFGGGSRAKR